MKPLRLLLVEDSENDARLMLRALERQGLAIEGVRVETGEELAARLDEGSWDLVLSDYHLPRFDGLEALQLVRARDEDIPFVMVSGRGGEELAVAAMRAGANDFLLKDHLSRLAHIVQREMRDVEIRRAQRASESELRRLSMAISQVPDAILITDPDGRIVYANPALESVSGFTLAEMVGRTPRIFQSGRHDAEFYRNLHTTVANRETWRGLFVNRRKDGRLWEAEALIAPVLDREGLLVSYVCTQRDVTHEHQLQAQLEHAQRLEAVGLLSAGIVHDFNNILMPVLAHAELALDRPDLDPDFRRHLEVIQASAQRAATLTRQLLGFTRTHTAEHRDLEFHRLVAESMKLLRAAIPATIDFRLDVDRASGFVHGDPTQLHQIVLNLCTNAFHAMQGGVGTLRVTLRKSRLPDTECVMGLCIPAGSYLVLEVSDTGRGIDPEVLPRIFLPFFTTKGPSEGTGLGLPIVLGIVQEMGGGIQVSSRPGEGSLFRVCLPEVPPLHTETPGPSREIPRGSERILLLEDDPTLLATLQIMLEGLGYEVTAAPLPTEALDRLAQNRKPFDLVLTDLTMPDMSGLEFAHQVRAQHPAQKILLMTGYLNLKDLQGEATLDDLQGVLSKPFTIQELAQKIRRTLDGRPGTGPVR